MSAADLAALLSAIGLALSAWTLRTVHNLATAQATATAAREAQAQRLDDTREELSRRIDDLAARLQPRHHR